MELEELNQQYLILKDGLKTAEMEVDKEQENLNELSLHIREADGELASAQINNDVEAQEQAKQKLQSLQGQKSEIEGRLLYNQNLVKQIGDSIEQAIEQVKQDPEVRQHMNEVMEKKYTRKLGALEGDRQKAVEDKEKLEMLKQIVTEHPALGNNLTGVLVAKKEINELNAELEKSKSEAREGAHPKDYRVKLVEQIDVAKEKLQKNMSPLLDYFAKNNINITEADINKIANNTAISKHMQDGRETETIQLKETLNRNISKANRQIKGYDKQIRHYTGAINNLGIPIVDQTETYEPQTETSHQTAGQTSPMNATSQNKDDNLNSQKPKWYQFRTRFNNWRERRKQRKLPDGKGTQTQDDPQPEATEAYSQTSQDFKDALKYDIVKDAYGFGKGGKDNKEYQDVKQAKQHEKEGRE